MPPKKGAAPAAPKKAKPVEPFNQYHEMKLTPLVPLQAPCLDECLDAENVFQQVNAHHKNLVFGITDIPNDVCGRRVVARQAIKAGSTVIIVRRFSNVWYQFTYPPHGHRT